MKAFNQDKRTPRSARASKRRGGGVEFSHLVCVRQIWHFQIDQPMLIPKEIRFMEEKFETFYQKKFEHRLLTWAYKETICEILEVDSEVTYTTTQLNAIIMLLFNEIDTLQFSEIIDQVIDKEKIKDDISTKPIEFSLRVLTFSDHPVLI